jgi:hypothetical protein
VPHSIHRWLTDLEHTACGLRRPHAVRGWREVTCQRCLGSIHAKLAQLQQQPPASPRAPGSLPPERRCPGHAARSTPDRSHSSPAGTWPEASW